MDLPVPHSLSLTPIGILRSPFREKFGIPRQPGLTRAVSRLVLSPECGRPECLEGLEDFSHLWLIFGFHATAGQGWRPTVRPPRLGGNARLGVFATRSMFRPNPLGLSVVELVGRAPGPQGIELLLRGADLLDGTPVYDIKPYLPYADCLPDARGGFAPEPPAALAVVWSAQAEQDARALALSPEMRALVGEVLAQDPRPAYAEQSHAPEREYGVWLGDCDVRFRVAGAAVEVLALARKRGA